MGKRLPLNQLELYKRVDEVLCYLWDPIGIAQVPEIRDEYHAYLPQIFRMTLEAKTNERLVAHLLKIESESLGYEINDASSDHATKIANLLIEHRNWIMQKYAEQDAAANP